MIRIRRVAMVAPLLSLAVSLASVASATQAFVSNTVWQLNVQDSTTGGSVTRDWVMLKDVTTAGACPSVFGLVKIMIRNDAEGDRQVSIINSALLSGRKIGIMLNDAKQDGGFCIAQFVVLK